MTISDDQGSERTYQIIGGDETGFARGRVRWLALARALLRSRAGDTVRFQSPAGSRTVDVVEVVCLANDD